MNIRFTTSNMTTYHLVEELGGTYTLKRYAPHHTTLVKDYYVDMEILELTLGKPARIKSKEPGYGDITTSPVTWIEVEK